MRGEKEERLEDERGRKERGWKMRGEKVERLDFKRGERR